MKLNLFVAGLLGALCVLGAGCAGLNRNLERVDIGGSDEPWIRVGLSVDESAVALTSDRELLLRVRSATPGREHVPREPGRELRIAPASGGAGWSLDGGRGYREQLTTPDTLVVDFESHPTESRLAWKDRHFTGRMLVFLNARGKITVVNLLPLEKYLAGVVPAEIGRAGVDGAEAIKAQAVAARTYTLFYLGRRAADGFDLWGTVEDQVYGGLEAEDPGTTALIRMTRGSVMIQDGRPIRAMYSACCGGMLASLAEAFPSPPLSYLDSHRDRAPDMQPVESFCEKASTYNWREEWTMDQFQDILAKFGPPDWRAEDGRLRGRVVDIRVAGRSSSGRAGKLEIETTTGTYSVDQMRIRSTLRRPVSGSPILRSTLLKIGVEYDGDTPLKVVATGAGNGHGVGMCQVGARAMATRGFVFEQILGHYYRGTRMQRWYD